MGYNTEPKVAILLPVYNGERTIHNTVESLLAQSFGDYRILACIDGSIDGSEEILRSFHDDRVQVIINKKNLGLGRTLNRLIYSLTWQPTYLAMAEQDDYYYPERLSLQVELMDFRLDVGMSSGIAEFWDGQNVKSLFPGLLVRGMQYPEGRDMFLLNYIEQLKVVNSCAMIRTSVHTENGLYFSCHYPNVSVDWSYVLRFSALSKIVGINQVLVRIERGPKRMSVTSDKERQHRTARELLSNFRFEMPEIIVDSVYREALVNHNLLELGNMKGTKYFLTLLGRLMTAPGESRYYHDLSSRLRRALIPRIFSKLNLL